MKAVYIFTKEYDAEKNSYTEQRKYSLGLVESNPPKYTIDGMKLTAENYCKMCIENDENTEPIIANLKVKTNTPEEWQLIEDEINKRYGDTARIKCFLRSLVPPFESPYNIDYTESQDI